MRNDDHDQHPLARMFLIGAIASVIGVAVALAIDWFPTAASKKAHEIDTLYDVLLIVSVPIFVLVMTVAIYSVVKFRARPGDMGDGAPIHGNTRLEVVWVVVPFLIVSSLAAYAWIVLSDVEAKQPNEMHVRVIGQQFAWHFAYPQYGGFKTDELRLEEGRQVELRLRALDVVSPVARGHSDHPKRRRRNGSRELDIRIGALHLHDAANPQKRLG